MSEFQPIRTIAELDLLDADEMLVGYNDGLNNAPEPGSDKSRSYWHGWRNGIVDRGFAELDSAQRELADAVVRSWRAH